MNEEIIDLGNIINEARAHEEHELFIELAAELAEVEDMQGRGLNTF